VDFPQFYIAGRLVLAGQTDALYPVPRPGSEEHPGLPGASDLRPAYASLARRLELTEAPRFIGPPPLALLFTPFALLPYERALHLWTLLLALAQWGTALIAARLLVLLAGRRTRLEGALVLAIALNPRSYVAIVQGNVTPLVALSIGLLALHGLHGRPVRAGASCLSGIVLKYAPAASLPVLAAARQWRTLAVTALFGAGIVVLSLVALGPDPLRIWLREVAPTLGRPYRDPYNQSLWSAAHPTDSFLAGPERSRVIIALASVVLLALLALLLRWSAQERRRPALFLSAIAAFLCWFLIFSPIAWNTYLVYLMPVWSWLLWEGTQSRIRGVLAGLSVALGSLPALSLWPWIGGGEAGLPPEPLARFGLLSWTVILAMAAARMWRGGGPSNAGPERGSPLRRELTPLSCSPAGPEHRAR
jgi:hypothetical protein